MFKRKKLWIIPIIAAIVTLSIGAVSVFAAPGFLPEDGQKIVTQPKEEETSLPSHNLIDQLTEGKEVGTYAIVNGKVIPIKKGMILGKAEDIKGPVVLCGIGDDYYNHGEMAVKNINGEIVVTKATMEHVEIFKHESPRDCGSLDGSISKPKPKSVAEIEGKVGLDIVHYRGWAETNLYHNNDWQTRSWVKRVEYYGDGEMVHGELPYDYSYQWLEPIWTLTDHLEQWDDGPYVVFLNLHGDFEDGFNHANVADFTARPGTYDYSGYIYPEPTPSWSVEVRGDRTEI